MSRRSQLAPDSRRTWRWPIVIAALSIFGLLSALLGQGGLWWSLSWIALSAPLLVIVWFVTIQRREEAQEARRQ